MYLLDTHILLWALMEDTRLPGDLRKIIVHPENYIWVSAASIWEIYIKQALGKLSLQGSVEDYVRKANFKEMNITFAHAKAAARLPKHHSDPFDRMLIAQAKVEKLKLLTVDAQFRLYGL